MKILFIAIICWSMDAFIIYELSNPWLSAPKQIIDADPLMSFLLGSWLALVFCVPILLWAIKYSSKKKEFE